MNVENIMLMNRNNESGSLQLSGENGWVCDNLSDVHLTPVALILHCQVH